MLAERGFEVTFLGVRAPSDPLVMPARERVAVRTLRRSRPGWRQKLHYARFLLWVLAWALRNRPEWVYASDPLSCPAAAIIAGLIGARVVYHEHDLPDASGTSAFLRLAFAARRRVLARANVCVVPNAQRAEALARDAGARPAVVWNCPRLREVTGPRRPAPPDRLRVIYQGLVVPARMPATIVESLAALPPAVSLVCVGYETVGQEGYVGRLRREAERLGVADRIEFAGPMVRADLLRLCASCDVGLALVPSHGGDPNLATLVGASNKAFEYLACGLALLVADLPDWRRTFVAAGFGLACDPADVVSVTAALRWMLAHPAERDAMGEAGRQRVLADWNYERTFAGVMAAMQTSQDDARAGRR